MPHFRHAVRADLPAIIRLLADDALGAERETATDAPHAGYVAAFEAIDADPAHTLLVAEQGGEVVAMLQMTIVPGLTYEGGTRGQIEGVRVRSDRRGGGLGRALLEAAIERFRDHGCRLVQLTTDKRRPSAIRFYEDVGFVASHEGMKMHLAADG